MSTLPVVTVMVRRKTFFTLGIFLCVSLVAKHNIVLAQANPLETKSPTVTTTTTIKQEQRFGGCRAALGIEYWQKAEFAEVTTSLTNAECGASHGEYKLQIRFRGDGQEMQSKEFVETWERSDSEPVQQTRLYEIGDDVDLISVRSRGLSCDCDEKVESESASEE